MLIAHPAFYVTIKEGLPGAVVYQCLQDKDGFMWFATNQSVSRFDGRVFRNFTKEDGLPDNEVLKLHLDKHGNILFVTLAGIPAVYSNGTITTIPHKGVLAIAEDRQADSILLIGSFKNKDTWYSGYCQ